MEATERRWAFLVLLVAACAALVLHHGQIAVSDAAEVRATAASLVKEADLHLEPGEGGVAGRDGRSVTKYGAGGVLLLVPPEAAAQAVAVVTGREDVVAQFLCSVVLALCGAALCASVAQLARAIGASRAWATAVAFAAVFGTYAVVYVTDAFFEPVVALALVRCALALGREDLLRAGAWLGAAVLVRPQNALLVVPLLVAAGLAPGRRSPAAAARLLAGPALAAAGCAAWNLLRFGDPFETGYRAPVDPGFTTPFLEGAAGLLADPAKSVLLFAPLVLLLPFAVRPAWRRAPAPTLFVAGSAAVLFVLAATWHSWQGGWSWGPRLLLPAVVPLLALLAALPPRRRRALPVLAVTGLAVSAAALLVPPQAQQLERDPDANGPSVTRQLALVPDTVERSVELGTRAEDHRQVLWPWQEGAHRELGRGGLLAALLATALLLAALAGAARALRRSLTAPGVR